MCRSRATLVMLKLLSQRVVLNHGPILAPKHARIKRHGFCLQQTMPRKHEDLICWQLSNELRQLIIEHTKTGPAARDVRFTSNLRDAIASACRNQSEGFYKYKHKPQRPYFNTARASLGETLDGIEDGRQREYFSG